MPNKTIDWDLFDVEDTEENEMLKDTELWQANEIIRQYEELLTTLAHRYDDREILEEMCEIKEIGHDPSTSIYEMLEDFDNNSLEEE